MKRPHHPLPKTGWMPTWGEPRHIKDLETWGSIARDVYNRNGFDSDNEYYDHDQQARFLYDFNFQTTDTAEVNWYLHYYVGCNQPSHDGYNWKFHSSAKPGIIYVPLPSKPLVMEDIPEIGIPNKIASALRDAEYKHEITEDIHWGLDVAEFIHIGLAVAEIEIAGAAGMAVELSGPAIGLALTAMALGMGHMDAMDEIKTRKVRLGIADGVILGVAAESLQFIKDYYVLTSTDHDPNYPDQRIEFQKTYLWGLTHGFAYSRGLRLADRFQFFKHLDKRTGYRPYGHFYVSRGARSETQRHLYYEDCAAAFLSESGLEE